MSYKPVKDRGSKRTSVTISEFAGSHYGVGLTDQWKGYSFNSDFDFFDKKMTLRHGSIKNDSSGKSNDIDTIFNMLIGDNNLIGAIHGGVLDLVSVNT